MWNIVQMKPTAEDPNWVIVVTTPAEQFVQEAARQGLNTAVMGQLTYLFNVEDERLRLVGLSNGTAGQMKDASPREAKLFDLVACPS